MSTKLYAVNLPDDTTAEKLRSHFATRGAVVDVEILEARNGSYGGPRAVVTMSSTADAERARTELDGTEYEGQKLRVTVSKREEAPKAPTVKLKMQFRQADAMIYEFDCNGTPIKLRLVREVDGVSQIEASSPDEPPFVGKGPSRQEALRSALADWNAHAVSMNRTRIDEEAIVEAMRAVRAF